MAKAKAIVLRAAGTNCDLETHYALTLAGAETDRVHINRVIERPRMLDEYQILVIPGGFSYGDDIAAGKIFANQIMHHLADPMRRFIDAEKLILGICNGFQVLVKAMLLPGPLDGDNGDTQTATLTNNDSGKFEDRWVHLKSESPQCVFIEPGQVIYLPVAHAEGKFVPLDETVMEKLRANGQIVFRYVGSDGEAAAGYPENPNGSPGDVAGICDRTGRLLGLMPHPERHILPTHHPQWTRKGPRDEGDGLQVFRRAVAYFA
ncbi:MAG: phosphoribosylformylglycinamidine synthase I [Planctomycetia bacterium]|nr:phosphoribosylformylglycinamidine synthase I [Planctomycetia bacterium]